MKKHHKRKEKCILTFARGWNSLAAARCLGEKGVEVITGDNNYLAAGNFSKHSKHFFVYPDPEKKPQKYLDKLVKMAKKHSSHNTDLVLMPLHTDSFLVAANKERFEGIAKLALPSFDQIKMAGNKALLAEFCRQHEILIPKTWQPKSRDEFHRDIINFEFPAFIKLQESNAAIGLKKVNTPNEAIAFFEHCVERYKLTPEEYPIIQQAVDGEDYCSTFLLDNGVPKASMTYHNILDFPRKSGMGVLRETVDATEIEMIGARLLTLLNWHGVAEIDFRWDGKNKPYLIEVNPRFWGGLGQSIASGWDYPYMLFKLAVNGTIDAIAPQPKDIRTFNPCLTVLLAAQEFIEAKHPRKEVENAFHKLRHQFKHNQVAALRKFVGRLAHAANPADRFIAVEKVLKENRGAVDEIFKWKDPLPLLGLLYPVAVFLKHGKVSAELLASKSKIEKN
ncbi:MAG: ATP-grasp domain-containing protein [Lentisphaerae bacterium]|nr:ATP-grasp domain-containing protein [Lentisphaerota bacterium]MCP4102661.1 ATP-grasp domain-containing protein [Lentisphaerota bacterium]